MARDPREEIGALAAPGWLTLGTLIGAGVALLLAPKSGHETREFLREKGGDLARRAQERAVDAYRAQGGLAGTQGKAEELIGQSKEVVGDTLGRLVGAVEAARLAVRDEIARRRGKDQPLEEGWTMGDDRRNDLNFLGALGLITVGAIIGAGVALLLAPKSGEETREILRETGTDMARRAQERSAELAKRAHETVGDAQSRAQEYLGRGKEVMEEKAAQLRAAFEAGRGAMREEISKLRTKDEPLEGV